MKMFRNKFRCISFYFYFFLLGFNPKTKKEKKIEYVNYFFCWFVFVESTFATFLANHSYVIYTNKKKIEMLLLET